jgi:hypothetical protein
VASLEFLRAEKTLGVAELEARKLARKVAAGCTGSGARFIRVAQLLERAGLSGRDALGTAVELSLRTDREAETFIAVFRKAFLEEYLNLDLRSAMKMARSLSTEFDGDVLAVRDDFERVLEFCVSEKTLGLPPAQCGTIAARIAREGSRFSGGIGDSFLRLVEFARSPEKGPGLATHQALALAEEIASAGGRGSSESFVEAYRYAVSAGGLGASPADAIAFARELVTSPGSGSGSPGSGPSRTSARSSQPDS